jgi:signal transduction histidine kinase
VAIRTGRLSGSASRTAAGVALTVLVAASVAAVLTQTAFRDADRRADIATARGDADRFESAVAVLAARADQLAAAAAVDDASFRFAARPLVADDAFAAAAVIDRDGMVRAIAQGQSVAPLRDSGDTSQLPQLTIAIADATGTARPQLAAPVALRRGPAVIATAPLIPAGTGLGAAARREATTGVVAVVAPFDDLRAVSGAAALHVRSRSGAFGDAVDSRLLRTSIRAGDDVWTVDIGRPSGGGTRAGWFVFLAGLLAAAMSYPVVRRQREREEVAESAARERASHLEVIADTSAALQQSLDLADLLPSFCVEIAAQFRRSCVSVQMADDQGRLVEVFRYGTATDLDAVTEIDLRRGWRTMGRLVLRGDSPLDDVAGQSMQALADLLAVAVSNAALYQREQEAVARLSELDALKNAFLGTVSHELRTSTTAVQGFGDLLTEHWDALTEERRRELAGRIRRQAGSLRHLVDDLLDYARLEHDSLRVSPRRVDLSDLVQQLADSMAPLTPTHQLEVRIEEAIDAWVDPVAVERILANLLSNAGKYAPPGSRVTVGVERTGDRARLWVSDEGPGIPADERRRVFVRFYRLSNPETIRTRGAGIGLSILSDFAERSGATVTIDDAPGGGALIMVDFPTEPAEVPAEATV